MKSWMWVSFAVLFCALSVAGEIRRQPMDGSGLPKNVIIWTVDDGPDENGPDGDTQMMKVARFLSQKGIPATFFITGYPFANQPKGDSRSLIGHDVVGKQSVSMISQLVGLGHNVGNHSQNHLVIVGLTPLEIWYEFLSPQVFLLDEHQRSFHPFRTPGLWWNDYAYDVMAAHPYLNKLSGPIHADAGGQGFLELPGKDKVWLGGDWDCFRQGYSASVCGEMYYNYLRDLPHGAILLMHVRTEYMSGKEDTGDFPLRLAQYIVERLGAQYRYVALESLFGASSAELPPRGRERQWEVP